MATLYEQWKDLIENQTKETFEADTQDNTLHKNHSFAKTGRKIFPFTQNTKQPHFSLQSLQKNMKPIL